MDIEHLLGSGLRYLPSFRVRAPRRSLHCVEQAFGARTGVARAAARLRNMLVAQRPNEAKQLGLVLARDDTNRIVRLPDLHGRIEKSATVKAGRRKPLTQDIEHAEQLRPRCLP